MMKIEVEEKAEAEGEVEDRVSAMAEVKISHMMTSRKRSIPQRAQGNVRQSQEHITPPVMIGRNGKVLNLNGPAINMRGLQDIIWNNVGVTAKGRVEAIKDSFELFLINDILDIIMHEMNKEVTVHTMEC